MAHRTKDIRWPHCYPIGMLNTRLGVIARLTHKKLVPVSIASTTLVRPEWTVAPKHWLIKPMTTTGKVHQRQQQTCCWSFFSTHQHMAHRTFATKKAPHRVQCRHTTQGPRVPTEFTPWFFYLFSWVLPWRKATLLWSKKCAHGP